MWNGGKEGGGGGLVDFGVENFICNNPFKRKATNRPLRKPKLLFCR